MTKELKRDFDVQEINCMQMAVELMLEDFNSTEMAHWNQLARKERREIIRLGKSALKKLQDITGIRTPLPDVEPGDVDQFLTKES